MVSEKFENEICRQLVVCQHCSRKAGVHALRDIDVAEFTVNATVRHREQLQCESIGRRHSRLQHDKRYRSLIACERQATLFHRPKTAASRQSAQSTRCSLRH